MKQKWQSEGKREEVGRKETNNFQILAGTLLLYESDGIEPSGLEKEMRLKE